MQIQKEIRIYQTASNQRPFEDWLRGLKDRKAVSVIRNRLDRLAYGLLGKCEPVGDGVFELKIYYGPGYRVYFGQDGREIVVLVHGGDKSSQREDIVKAKHYWKDYEKRK